MEINSMCKIVEDDWFKSKFLWFYRSDNIYSRFNDQFCIYIHKIPVQQYLYIQLLQTNRRSKEIISSSDCVGNVTILCIRVTLVFFIESQRSDNLYKLFSSFPEMKKKSLISY